MGLRSPWLSACRLSLIFIIPVFLSACGHVPVKGPVTTTSLPPPPAISRLTVMHEVAPGETLWRISRMYDVKIEDIMKANNLTASDQLVIGQRLLIPNAGPPCAIIPLYPSKKWKYIIIHHSATDEGNSLMFNTAHLRRGFWGGLGYHFVIDNGTRGKPDGQIEVSPRWLKQENGAHCQAAGMNTEAIGICLVGNFSKEDVSEKQMESLVCLVNILRRYYHIATSDILGHGQVKGALTACPGAKFPWQEFFLRLKNQEGEVDKLKINLEKSNP